jgi:phosphoribosylanthranilate isomerase
VTRIKICGLTNDVDARHAAVCGAQFLGFVLAASPRRADPSEVAHWLPAIRRAFPAVRVVGVFVRPSAADVAEAVARLRLDLVQVHGMEHAAGVAAQFAADLASPRPLILAAGPEALVRAAAVRPWAVLADRVGPTGEGGTGVPLDWAGLAEGLPAGLQRAEEPSGPAETTTAAGVASPGPPARIEAAPCPPRLFLAGGLEAGNVAEAMRVVRPWAVDASSCLEMSPGRKDPAKVAAFCDAVRIADGGSRRGS